MKKILLVSLALMMALMVLCSACGGSKDDTTAPTQEPEATELPSVTAPPQENGDESENAVSANANRQESGQVYATVYEDGTEVYVNYSDEPAVIGDLTVPAMGFVRKGER